MRFWKFSILLGLMSFSATADTCSPAVQIYNRIGIQCNWTSYHPYLFPSFGRYICSGKGTTFALIPLSTYCRGSDPAAPLNSQVKDDGIDRVGTIKIYPGQILR